MKWYSKEKRNVFESFIHSIHSNGWFIQELSKQLSGPLNHWFTQFVQNADSFILNNAMLLSDAQQFCCGFIGNIFIGKIEEKHAYCI